MGDRANRVKKIFHFEALGKMEEDLSARFGLTLSFKHLNHSSTPKVSHGWRDEEVALITQVYRKDFEALGYSLEPPAE